MPIQRGTVPFDFSVLRNVQLAVKIDIGASTYWSEISNVQTCENLLMNGHINAVQFLERLPEGYLSKRQELIDELKAQQQAVAPPATTDGTGMSMESTSEQSESIQPHGGSGNGSLQRALNREGA